jgi:hypothetical protein
MAYKRKKTVGKKPKKRRRMGAAGKLNFATTAGTAVGVVGTDYLLAGPLQTTTLAPIGAIALGLIVPRFTTNGFIEGLGNGMIGMGIVSLLQNAGVVNGIGRTVLRRQMGAQPLSSVAGGRGRRMALNPAQVRAMTTVKNAGRTVLNGVPRVRPRPLSSVNGPTRGFCDATI